MSKTTFRWGNLAVIFILLSLAGLCGFVACLSGRVSWLVPQVIVWIAALVMLIRSGRP
ncbi:hypothetical protein [Luteibacter sp. 22Crub2.1]|uniref:hypothetical protein n=1 Tax=Luteibacter sp. 22Crub2.1 TaxID=1283288 RepID=UPI0009C59816|nr:hypothetical protein [Luteibacter sp. 22Crub2.1]SKB51193.1 hypothetical protein SAMN05660880_01395 [Luteibacter sp. 22Crub2.1]